MSLSRPYPAATPRPIDAIRGRDVLAMAATAALTFAFIWWLRTWLELLIFLGHTITGAG